MVVKRFEIPEQKNVLITEDVITTGKSSMESAGALEPFKVNIVALACVVDRRAETDAPLKWPVYAAWKANAGNWDAGDCALCKKGVPVVKPGSRKFSG
jgi:orotate phosphoribosyltransferase